MKTIFGYHVINVPGTWTYKLLKASDFEPKFNKFKYRKIEIKDLSYVLKQHSPILQVEDEAFDKHVNEILNIQVDNICGLN